MFFPLLYFFDIFLEAIFPFIKKLRYISPQESSGQDIMKKELLKVIIYFINSPRHLQRAIVTPLCQLNEHLLQTVIQMPQKLKPNS